MLAFTLNHTCQWQAAAAGHIWHKTTQSARHARTAVWCLHRHARIQQRLSHARNLLWLLALFDSSRKGA